MKKKYKFFKYIITETSISQQTSRLIKKSKRHAIVIINIMTIVNQHMFTLNNENQYRCKYELFSILLVELNCKRNEKIDLNLDLKI